MCLHEISIIPRLSIVVATYRRPEHLARLLNALIKQSAGGEDFEIIVIDNDNDPCTQVQEMCASNRYQKLNLRYYYHAQLGTSNARNRGVEESRAELIAFLDDDTLPPPDWIAKILEIRTNINVDVFGGPFTPFYSSKPPRWFKDKYATLNYGSEARWLVRNKYLAGANMIWSRNLFLNLGGFSEKFGYVGNKKSWGEDTDLCQRATLAGNHIWYDPSLKIQHHFESERMSVKWLVRRIVRHKQMMAYLIIREARLTDKRPVYRQIFSILKKLVYYMFGFLKSSCLIVFRKREDYPYIENYLVEEIGRELGQISLMFDMIRCLLFSL